MKRLHLHVDVDDLDKNVGFYSALFGEQPDKVEADYARWLLDDPQVNFAISTRSQKLGIDHLGIQVDSSEELDLMRERLKDADQILKGEGETSCCYAVSEKSWVNDPSGLAWETFQTKSDVSEYFGSIAQSDVDAQTELAVTRSCC